VVERFEPPVLDVDDQDAMIADEGDMDGVVEVSPIRAVTFDDQESEWISRNWGETFVEHNRGKSHVPGEYDGKHPPWFKEHMLHKYPGLLSDVNTKVPVPLDTWDGKTWCSKVVHNLAPSNSGQNGPYAQDFNLEKETTEIEEAKEAKKKKDALVRRTLEYRIHFTKSGGATKRAFNDNAGA